MDENFEIGREQEEKLLRLARATLDARLNDRQLNADTPLDSALSREAATFVTLKKNGHLRGCIGTLEPSGTLWESVKNNVENAAFHDTRFAPMSLDELDQVHISISILTPPQPLAYTDSDELVRILRPGVDGVILRYGGLGATFLPQVWEQLSTPEIFLSHLCRKAGLDENCWRTEKPEITIYHVQSLSEEEK